MNLNLKVPAIVAGIAFVIAFFSAAVSRLGFGSILLRSLLGGIAFGALGFGFEALARRFLPELFDAGIAGNAKAEEESTFDENAGGSVDITIEEENPHMQDAGISTAAVVDEVEEVEEVIEVAPEDDVEELETVDESGSEPVPSSEVEGAPAFEATAVIPSATPSASNTGDLPAFDGVESSFDPTYAVGNIEGAGGHAAGSAIDVMGQEQDAETVAKAVRTLLKRDEKG